MPAIVAYSLAWLWRLHTLVAVQILRRVQLLNATVVVCDAPLLTVFRDLDPGTWLMEIKLWQNVSPASLSDYPEWMLV